MKKEVFLPSAFGQLLLVATGLLAVYAAVAVSHNANFLLGLFLIAFGMTNPTPSRAMPREPLITAGFTSLLYLLTAGIVYITRNGYFLWLLAFPWVSGMFILRAVYEGLPTPADEPVEHRAYDWQSYAATVIAITLFTVAGFWAITTAVNISKNAVHWWSIICILFAVWIAQPSKSIPWEPLFTGFGIALCFVFAGLVVKLTGNAANLWGVMLMTDIVSFFTYVILYRS